MTRDCGAWINLLAHQVKKRMNATLSDLGITGVQSRVMHYILEHCQNGPVFQRDVEAAFNLSRSTTTNILQAHTASSAFTRCRMSAVHTARQKWSSASANWACVRHSERRAAYS